MKYTFLTKKFYKDYPHTQYPQMELKDDRPYAHIHIKTYGQLFVFLYVQILIIHMHFLQIKRINAE